MIDPFHGRDVALEWAVKFTENESGEVTIVRTVSQAQAEETSRVHRKLDADRFTSEVICRSVIYGDWESPNFDAATDHGADVRPQGDMHPAPER